MAEHKRKGHKFRSTHIEHHHDGSATVHHQHEDGADHDVKHAAANLDGVHDSMQDHLGTPNPGEAEADGGSMAGVGGAPGAAPTLGGPGGAPGGAAPMGGGV